MNYEAFRNAWERALHASRLSSFGLDAAENLELRSLDRTYEIHVEPLGGQDAPPFHVTATLCWYWTALQTARATSRDDDIVTEVLGRDQAEGLETERPTLRIDITLAARAPYDKPLPMPAPKAWAEWVREVMGRLERIEPLIPDEDVRVNGTGLLEVLAWQQKPTVTARCSPTGELLLQAVEVAAGQLIELPRVLDDSDQVPDDGQEQQLRELFHRVRASLTAWMQALDHLRPR